MTSGSPTSFESATPTRIGAGSFATVFSVRGQPFVYKVIHHSQRADELRAEITALHCLYLRCNSTSMFAIPRAFAYHNPDTGELVQFPLSPLIGGLRELRPWVNQDTFHGFTSAAYIMDRAHALPVRIANVVRDQFYPAAAIAQGVESPLMCRLYFGKVIRPSKFVNSINFPLDVHRYKSLLGSCEPGSLFTAKEVAVGMGEMLGRIHWLCGYDGRDIEFVLAGSGYPGTVRYFVIDFNQMRHFSAAEGDIEALVESFFCNDPYYPLPNPSEELYQEFRGAYIAACPEEYRPRAREFIAAIEGRQASMI